MRFDWQSRLGVRVEDFLAGRISWNEAWDYVSELLREPSSHLSSALRGDKYVPDPSERAALTVFEGYVNMQIKGGHKKLTRPWTGKAPNYKPAPIGPSHDASSIARREKLAALF